MVYLSSIAVCCSSDVYCINSFRHSLAIRLRPFSASCGVIGHLRFVLPGFDGIG